MFFEVVSSLLHIIQGYMSIPIFTIDSSSSSLDPSSDISTSSSSSTTSSSFCFFFMDDVELVDYKLVIYLSSSARDRARFIFFSGKKEFD
jgi:hypothetical protein